ncbi:DUF2336 domain-containing protein [Roseibium sp. CAU 1637]|uniref:DUF2336 domain-containing protein n=1 Tax=Roseibium limicola TaxID=2816037 RepID=A0A939ELF0_9HYPH|nr:DUF2336 domain-containing protein [Roseibium limicola]MBO0344860.1 DUF2336 domain-containing protein [Roseibium limicola]
MLIPHLLTWLQTADDLSRVQAASALARAWIESDLNERDRDAARSALILLVDDRCSAVRRALCAEFAHSDSTPRAVLFGLLQGEDDVAVEMLQNSPLLGDGDLIVVLGDEGERRQCAVASRPQVSAALAAAIAEIASAEACECLLGNRGAHFVPRTLRRLVERFGHDHGVRHLLLDRSDITLAHRYDLLMRQMLETMTGCFGETLTRPEDLPDGVVEETSDRIVLQSVEMVSSSDLTLLIDHLRQSGRLTTRLLLRAVCCGRLRFFAQAMSALSKVPVGRVSQVLSGVRGAAMQALLRKAGLPVRSHQTFQLAVAVLRSERADFTRDLGLTEARNLTEILLAELQDEALGENGDILSFLRGFALDVSRLEARAYLKKTMQAQIGQASAA